MRTIGLDGSDRFHPVLLLAASDVVVLSGVEYAAYT